MSDDATSPAVGEADFLLGYCAALQLQLTDLTARLAAMTPPGDDHAGAASPSPSVVAAVETLYTTVAQLRDGLQTPPPAAAVTPADDAATPPAAAAAEPDQCLGPFVEHLLRTEEGSAGRPLGLQGSNESLSMTAVFSFLSSGKKSGTLYVSADTEVLVFEFVMGEVTSSRCTWARGQAGDVGQDARELVQDRFYRVFTASRVDYGFFEWEPGGEDALRVNVNALLLDTARVDDESKRLKV
ncbi:MAG: DUF4388 domain-containing protein [Planctomycetota bacterium]